MNILKYYHTVIHTIYLNIIKYKATKHTFKYVTRNCMGLHYH